jgi:hypothetical protein
MAEPSRPLAGGAGPDPEQSLTSEVGGGPAPSGSSIRAPARRLRGTLKQCRGPERQDCGHPGTHSGATPATFAIRRSQSYSHSLNAMENSDAG